ncbi:MAG: DUF1819 family protein [Bacteroidales bacterium]
MISELKYSSQIKDMGLLSKEMKIACQEFCVTKDLGVIIQKSINNNIFMVNTERRRKELAYKLIVRMAFLDDYLIQTLANSTYNTSSILSLYALMKSDRIVFEFMYEIIRDKIQLMNYRLTDVELNQFIVCKAQQDDLVARWKDSNKIQVKSALRKILIDAGILRDLGSVYMVLPPLIDKNIIEHITKLGDEKYLEAMGVLK